MRLFSLLPVGFKDLRAQRGRSLVSILGIGFGVWVLLLVGMAGVGVREAVLTKLVGQLPVDMIEVVPKTLDLGVIQLGAGSLFGSATLSESDVARFKKIEGVSGVYPRLDVKLPMGARGGDRLFGRALYTDVLMMGIDASLLRKELRTGFVDKEGAIPVVVSEQLVELYNRSVAPSLGTPQFSIDLFRGFGFQFVLGRSMMLGERGAKKKGFERAVIHGSSPFAMRLGVTVPIESARRLLQSYADDPKEEYGSVLIRVSHPKLIPSVTEAVKATGFSIDQSAQRTADILSAATILASLLGLMVLALAALNIAHSFYANLSERQREFAVLRAVGATKGDVFWLFESQAALLGVGGGLLGLFLGILSLWILNPIVLGLLPDFPFKPDAILVFHGGLYVSALGLAIVSAVLGALVPALIASRRSITRMLAEL